MPHTNYDPAKQAGSPLYTYLGEGYKMPINGPGGNHQLTENNEKGILETGLAACEETTAELQADKSHRQGIYGSR